MKPALLLALAALASTADDAAALWTAKVQPLLQERCIECHGPQKAKARLRLDSREGMLAGGKELSPAVIPGKPDESPLVTVCLLPRDDEKAMPPKDPALTAEQIDWLKAWIAGGAPTP